MSPTAFLTVASCFVAVGAWLLAEFRGPAWFRRVTGFASIFFGIAAGYSVGWLGPQYNIARYELALDSIREHLEAGKASGVQSAIGQYRLAHKFPNPDAVALLQSIAATGSESE